MLYYLDVGLGVLSVIICFWAMISIVWAVTLTVTLTITEDHNSLDLKTALMIIIFGPMLFVLIAIYPIVYPMWIKYKDRHLNKEIEREKKYSVPCDFSEGF